MSANNCTLVRQFRKKLYIFQNVNAESWGDGKNELSLKDAIGPFDDITDAILKAYELDIKQGQWGEGTEYGVQVNVLCKDGAEVKIVK